MAFCAMKFLLIAQLLLLLQYLSTAYSCQEVYYNSYCKGVVRNCKNGQVFCCPQGTIPQACAPENEVTTESAASVAARRKECNDIYLKYVESACGKVYTVPSGGSAGCLGAVASAKLKGCF